MSSFVDSIDSVLSSAMRTFLNCTETFFLMWPVLIGSTMFKLELEDWPVTTEYEK